MDPPPSHINGADTQQPNVSFLSTVHGEPGGTTSPGWRSNAWGPITLQPSVFATGGNGIPVTPRAPPRHDCAELGGEPGGGTTLHVQGEGTGNLSLGDVPPTDNGASSDKVMTPAEEEDLWMLPKLREGRRIFCDQCPELPSFTGKNALRKHKKEVHASTMPQCPVCCARMYKQTLGRHLKRVHGITDAVVKHSASTVSTPTDTNGTAELVKGSKDAGSTIISHVNETTSGRVYCQEYNCGRGFSSKVHLESHVRFFHSKQPKQIVVVQAKASSSSKDAVERSAERPLEHYLSTSTVTPLAQGTDSSVRTHVPNLGDGYQGIDSVVESAGKQSETSIETPPSIRTAISTQQTTTGTLSLDCRMCEAPPTVTTEPTVTTCGHLFCSECITQHVASTSRCPVCNSSLLLYCLFKLDLPVTS